MRRMVVFVALALVGSALAAGPAAGTEALPGRSPARTSDFNGDGYGDVAIGAPFETLGDVEGAGVVHVLYGAATGLSSDANQFWTQGEASDGVDIPEPMDFFGFGLVTGDFDADGYADLVIGTLFEDLGLRRADAGEIQVIYGSPEGLTAERSQTWNQDSHGVKDVAEAGDQFGGGLGVGDFNGDGYQDLAVGARGETIGDAENAGMVHVLFGSRRGLTRFGNQAWNQDTPDVPEEVYPDDLFGVSLSGGDLNGDGYDDLAIGVIGEDIGPPGVPGSVGDAGAVEILYGSAAGPTALGSQVWTQDAPGVPGAAEDADLFGGVAVGDFDADGYGDLAIDAFNEAVGGADGAGSVTILYGSSVGAATDGAQQWTQNSRGVADTAEETDRFSGPTPGDFDGDGYDDLAIGAQGEDDGTGIIHVLYGSPAGITASGSQVWGQGSPGILEDAEVGDWFATSTAAGDFGNGPEDDLVIGVRESIGPADQAGAVGVLYGSPAGTSSAGNQLWTQDSPGIPDAAESADFFGIPVAAA